MHRDLLAVRQADLGQFNPQPRCTGHAPGFLRFHHAARNGLAAARNHQSIDDDRLSQRAHESVAFLIVIAGNGLVYAECDPGSRLQCHRRRHGLARRHRPATEPVPSTLLRRRLTRTALPSAICRRRRTLILILVVSWRRRCVLPVVGTGHSAIIAVVRRLLLSGLLLDRLRGGRRIRRLPPLARLRLVVIGVRIVTRGSLRINR